MLKLTFRGFHSIIWILMYKASKAHGFISTSFLHQDLDRGLLGFDTV